MTASPATGAFDSVEAAVQAVAAGGMVVVTDDEARENEGDLVMAASKATPEAVNMMIRHARGLICAPMTEHMLRHLGINPMVQENRESHRTAFTVSVDAAEGITTGISAFDRCRTLRLLADPETRPEQLVQPGHVFPLRAKPGGVLERAGHTEAAVDLATLAGLTPAAVICEILNEDGTLARLPELQVFRGRFGLPMISIAQLIEHRHRSERLVDEVDRRPFASAWGDFELRTFRSRLDGRRHHALTMGELDGRPTLVRVHSQNILADVFRQKGSDGARALEAAMARVAAEGRGVVLYMEHREEAAGPGQPRQGPGAHPMNLRDYGIGAQILTALGLRRIRLLSGSSRRLVGLEAHGLEIVEHIPV